VLEETRVLIAAAHNELEKTAWIDRAHRELRKRGLCRPSEEIKVRVRVDLEVEIHHGHPAQVLAAVREHLQDLRVEDAEAGVLACVENVARIEIL